MSTVGLRIDTALRQLKMPGAARLWRELLRDAEAAGTPADQFLATLLEAERANRRENVLRQRLRDARFPVVKTLEAYGFTAQPSVNKALVLTLARGTFLREGFNVCLVGNTGTGKTHVGIALGVAMLQEGYRVRYVPAVNLVSELLAAAEQHQLPRALRQWRRFDLVICDDVGYIPLSRDGAQCFFLGVDPNPRGNRGNNPLPGDTSASRATSGNKRFRCIKWGWRSRTLGSTAARFTPLAGTRPVAAKFLSVRHMGHMYDFVYFVRDCPVQWPLRLWEKVEVIPVGELARTHEARFMADTCEHLSIPCHIDPTAFRDHPMCKTPIAIISVRKVQAGSIEEAEQHANGTLDLASIILGIYWKQPPKVFGIIAFDRTDQKSYWRLVEWKLRRVVHLPIGDPRPALNDLYEKLRENPLLKHWFALYIEAISDSNRDYRIFKLMSLLEVIGKHLSLSGRASGDAKELMRAAYVTVGLGLPPKHDAYDGIDVLYRHRHCSAHWGGCDPGRVLDCKTWCRERLSDRDELAERLQEDLWFILMHARALL